MRKKLICIGLFGMFVSMSGARAEGLEFSNETIEGIFAVFAQRGLILEDISRPPIPLISAGTAVSLTGTGVFNEDGTCLFDVTIQVGAALVPGDPDDTCDFDIAPDGTGVIEIVNDSSPLSTLTLAVTVINEDKVVFVGASDKLHLSGVFERQDD